MARAPLALAPLCGTVVSMSTETNPELVARMLRPCEEALSDPDEAERGLDALITQTQTQTQLPASVRRDLVTSLEKQRKGLRAARIAAIASELRTQLKAQYGLVIEFRVMQRRKSSAKPAAPEVVGEKTPNPAPSALEGPGERGGILRRAE